MTLIRSALLILVGFAGAGFVAAGTFAFITMLGIVPRLAGRTGTAKYILFYENLIILGGAVGNFFSIRGVEFSMANALFGSRVLLLAFGLFAGVFVGCLAMALAEVLQVIPVFAKRIKLQTGMPIIVIAIALGKMIGSFCQFFFGWRL